ncbi:stage II sporulation protein P [Rummeliibacillus sp. NPDC094406]|uniref:stage II sporulation protein P n=1 Tax=Rummeliibacillus sp. NPDC094406 TaxID=3364511 RepID=UPI003807FAAE
MQNDKEIFDLIKKTYPLTPNKDFVQSTEEKLRKAARKLNRKKVYKKLSIVSSGLLLCVVVIISILTYTGNQSLDQTATSSFNTTSSSITNKRDPVILIHHTHNYESFKSKTKIENLYDEKQNITLVGKRLSEKLEEKRIPNIQDTSNIFEILKKKELHFGSSYSVSRGILEDIINKNKSIEMVLDIHRDSAERNTTTIKRKGKNYARIIFVVSHSSDNYKETKRFAQKLHNILESKYPGLSRGIVVKDNGTRQSTYNLDLMDQSVLVEIGGAENTLEEEYRTVDLFVEVIEEIMKEKNIR